MNLNHIVVVNILISLRSKHSFAGLFPVLSIAYHENILSYIYPKEPTKSPMWSSHYYIIIIITLHKPTCTNINAFLKM